MNLRFFLFLTIVVLLVIMAVMYHTNREQPWDSGVFFSSLEFTPKFTKDLNQDETLT